MYVKLWIFIVDVVLCDGLQKTTRNDNYKIEKRSNSLIRFDVRWAYYKGISWKMAIGGVVLNDRDE